MDSNDLFGGYELRSTNIETAKRLPENIRFGTSSWKYPGWKGIVYHDTYRNDADFKKRCLKEYGRYPWFRSIGIDHSFYVPPKVQTLESYANDLPESIKWVSKVWEEITIPIYAKHKRYGDRAGQENPNFLNTDLFLDQVLAPFEQAKVENRLAAFVFEFQTLGQDYTSFPELFFDRLDKFLGKLPKQFHYAVEIRNPYFLVDDYFSVLNNHKVTHCFNHWTRMPRLKKQMLAAARVGGLEAPFYVARLLTPLGVSYADAVKRFDKHNEVPVS